jgi:hypothetical protein
MTPTLAPCLSQKEHLAGTVFQYADDAVAADGSGDFSADVREFHRHSRGGFFFLL